MGSERASEDCWQWVESGDGSGRKKEIVFGSLPVERIDRELVASCWEIRLLGRALVFLLRLPDFHEPAGSRLAALLEEMSVSALDHAMQKKPDLVFELSYELCWRTLVDRPSHRASEERSDSGGQAFFAVQPTVALVDQGCSRLILLAKQLGEGRRKCAFARYPKLGDSLSLWNGEPKRSWSPWAIRNLPLYLEPRG